MDLLTMCQGAKRAAYEMNSLSTRVKNDILLAMAKGLRACAPAILEANKRDLAEAEARGKSKALLDRLALSQARIDGMASGLEQVAKLADPVGEVMGGETRPNGLRIVKKRVPLGVVGMIYEARPNVTADAVGLCIKTGNAVILKGGSDAIHSNQAVAEALMQAGREAGLPEGAVNLIEDTSRAAAEALMKMNGYVDVLIPRGGAGLIQSVVKNATVPVIETGTGNCHVYVDEGADLDMAADIVVNAKTSRPGVCNAIETLLVSEKVADAFLPRIIQRLREKDVEIRGCERTCAYEGVIPATEEDYATEFLDYIIAVKVVKDVEEAVRHINEYGTKHSECIVTPWLKNSEYFQANVDAAAVYVNASTRFTDGEEFGFGAEIGISTQKLHARGPMGLRELTTYKYLIHGEGQIR